MIRKITVFSLAMSGSLLLSGPLMAESLKEALEKAYSSNPTLAAQRANLRQTDEGVAQAISGWRPDISASGEFGTKQQDFSNSTNSHRKPRSFGVDLTQSIYAGGSTQADIKTAENDVLAARARLLATEQSILLEAVTAYMDVYRDQAILRLKINNEQVLRRHLEAARDRFEVGEITRTDVHQSEARHAGATAERIKAEGDLAVSRAAYQNVIGQAPGELEKVDPLNDIPEDEQAAIKLSLRDNPSVVAAEYDVASSKSSVDSTRGSLLPSVDFSASADRDFDSSLTDNNTNTFVAKVTLSVPLYQQGTVYSQLREAKQKVAESRLTVDVERRDAVEALTQSWKTLEAARARVQSFKAQILANEIALDGVIKEESVGSRTVLNVLDAEQELLNSQVDLVGAERDEVVGTYAVKEAIGQLSAVNLGLGVDVYNPDQHYKEIRGKWFGTGSPGQDEGPETTRAYGK